MASSTVLAWIFNKEISLFGADLMMRYGQNQVDFVLFLVTAVSCTPLVLPVWGYALVGMTLGYDLLRLASVMALGSAVGSLVTFAVGRYFSNNAWVKRKFPAIRKHPWTHGKSKKYVTWVLFIGTASPIPCDVVYAACGAKRYPVLPFFLMMVSGRLVRYTYLGGLYGYLTGSL
ncbi:MAG: DedA family protein [Candidatus Zixiibacteriota bacterium]|nr:MAG: DedA family protein [candidate division Zixibacteria bacterium]